MNKILILVLSLQTISYSIKAQYDKRLGFIGISAGGSIPVNDFASSNIHNSAAGMALPGLNLNISFGHTLGEYWGIGALFFRNAHNIDSQAISDGLKAEAPAGTKIALSPDPDPWIAIGGMTGIFVSVPARNFSLDFRLLIGVISVTSPQVYYSVSNGGGSSSSLQESSDAYAFSYNIGVGGRYRVSNDIALMANIDYMAASIDFPVSRITNTTTKASQMINAYTQPYAIVNISGGLAFLLH